MLLKCPFKTIDDLYDWLEGEDMLLSDPPPYLMRLLNAERLMWSKVVENQYMRIPMETTLLDIRKDPMFWWRKVFEAIPVAQAPQQTAPPQLALTNGPGMGGGGGGGGGGGRGRGGKGKGGKATAQTQPQGNSQLAQQVAALKAQVAQFQGGNPGRNTGGAGGKGGKGGKGGGRGQGSGMASHVTGGQWPGNAAIAGWGTTLATTFSASGSLFYAGVQFADWTPDGTGQFCHFNACGKCARKNCKRIHRCPIIGPGGKVCDKDNHDPARCNWNKP